MIITRYLYKEIILVLLAVTGTLLLTFLSNQLVRYLSVAAAGKLSGWIVLKLMLLQVPHLLGTLLPLSLFLSILLAYGRLYADNELTVLLSCGMSRTRLLRLTIRFAAALAIIVALITLWLDPYLVADRNRLLAEANAATALQTMLPGRFEEARNGKLIVYVESLSVDRKRMHNVFVAEQIESAKQNSAWTVTAAGDGYQQIDKKTGDVFFITTHGHRYEGIPGQKDYSLLGYEKYGVKMQEHPIDINNTEEGGLPTFILLRRYSKPAYAAELQWRFSMPFSCLILAWLAVSMLQSQPRQKRYQQLLPAMLLYIIYANLLLVSRSWVTDGKHLGFLGMGYIHLLLCLLTALLWWGLKFRHWLKQLATSYILQAK